MTVKKSNIPLSYLDGSTLQREVAAIVKANPKESVGETRKVYQEILGNIRKSAGKKK